MNRSTLPLAALLLAATAACTVTPPPEAPIMPSEPDRIAYPATRAEPIVERMFGVEVADPYRWLENDVRNDPAVRDWVTAQNAVTDAFLAKLPLRAEFSRRMTELYDYERIALPAKKGGRFFYRRNDGLQNQSVLYVRETLNGPARMLIDPNGWSKDGATALGEWEASEDGAKVLYSIQDGGSDWRTVRVLDVATGQVDADEVKWVKYSDLSWAKDGSGFYYSRFAEPKAGQAFQSATENQQIYFHRLGTSQSSDRLVFATPGRAELLNSGVVSDDGRWLVVSSSPADKNEIALVDLARSGSAPRVVLPGFEHNYTYIGNRGSTFYFQTNDGAPRWRVIALDVSQGAPAPRTVIAEDSATLDAVSLVGGSLIASYMVDAKTEVRVHDLDGRLKRKIALPGIGAAWGFDGEFDDQETFFAFTSFNRPNTIYRYDVASGAVSEWATPKVAFDPEDYSVEQRFFTSKDGTKVPMFVVMKKGLARAGGSPTQLFGYGGFNASSLPAYSPTNLAWIDAGGVYALANIRGGGEYGKAWHDAGKLANKQNVFDDFIAAGEYLKSSGIASPKGLSIRGGSNGGLLVGAVLNQRPDLFDAANPAVGVMDMLRFDRWTAGRYWVDDYGYPNKEADFRTLLAYSPYHNIRGGRDYPPVLVTTADTDDRVVPGHSFKYIARLQNTPGVGNGPHLIRIETRAGHGSGKPTKKIIEEAADVMAFLGHFTGLDATDR